MTPTEVLTRMLNSFSADWEVTEERVQALFQIGGFARPQEAGILLDMVKHAKGGATRWIANTERILAVRGALIGARHPTSDAIGKLVKQVIAGALHDKVSDRIWVKDTIRMLETLSKLTP